MSCNLPLVNGIKNFLCFKFSHLETQNSKLTQKSKCKCKLSLHRVLILRFATGCRTRGSGTTPDRPGSDISAVAR